MIILRPFKSFWLSECVLETLPSLLGCRPCSPCVAGTAVRGSPKGQELRDASIVIGLSSARFTEADVFSASCVLLITVKSEF